MPVDFPLHSRRLQFMVMPVSRILPILRPRSHPSSTFRARSASEFAEIATGDRSCALHALWVTRPLRAPERDCRARGKAAALLLASGMGYDSTTVLANVSAGDHIVAERLLHGHHASAGGSVATFRCVGHADRSDRSGLRGRIATGNPSHDRRARRIRHLRLPIWLPSPQPPGRAASRPSPTTPSPRRSTSDRATTASIQWCIPQTKCLGGHSDPSPVWSAGRGRRAEGVGDAIVARQAAMRLMPGCCCVGCTPVGWRASARAHDACPRAPGASGGGTGLPPGPRVPSATCLARRQMKGPAGC